VTVLLVAGVLCAVPAWSQLEEEGTLETEMQSLLGAIGFGEPMSEKQLKERVEEIGGLRLLKPIPMRFVSKADLEEYLQRVFDEEYPIEEARREQAFLEFLGLIPKGYDLRAQRMQLLLENVAGFYDEKDPAGALYTVSRTKEIDFLNSLILSHEIRHAIQDQHFGLARKIPDVSDFDDRRLAALATYEGDATYVMMRFMGLERFDGIEEDSATELPTLFPAEDISSLIGAAAAMAGGTYAAAPEILQRQLLLPYIEGEKFTEALFRRGGLREMNAALASPPATSEQLLHPEKYFARELPPDRRFDLSREMGGQRPVFEGVLGEFYMACLFDDTTGPRAVTGWNGDFYQFYRDTSGRRTLVWTIGWDRASDVPEFIKAFEARAGSRFLQHGQVQDIRDADGIAVRVVQEDATTITILKSDDTKMVAQLSVRSR